MKSNLFTFLQVVIISFLVLGCTSAVSGPSELAEEVQTLEATGVPTHTPTPTDTPAPTSTSTPTPTPTITPTPIGGSALPIYAMTMYSEEDLRSYIIVRELFSDREIARVPTARWGTALGLSHDGEYLAFSNTSAVVTGNSRQDHRPGIFLYNLRTQEISRLWSAPEIQSLITEIRWSPDQKWLAIRYSASGPFWQIWVIDVSNGAPSYLINGWEIDWLPSGELLHRSNTHGTTLYNPVTGSSERFRHSFYYQGISYSRDLYPSGLLGWVDDRSDQERQEYYAIRRNLDSFPGLHLASYQYTDPWTAQVRDDLVDLLLSPDGNVAMVFREVDKGGGWPFSAERLYTSWAMQDAWPVTEESFTVENFQPLLWAPDSGSILGLHHDLEQRNADLEDEAISNMDLTDIDGIEILDVHTGDVLHFHDFSGHGDLIPDVSFPYYDRGSPQGFDVVWNENQVDLSAAGLIPDPVPPDQYLMDFLQSPELIRTIDLTAFEQHWDFYHAEMDAGNVTLTASGSWDAHLDYPGFDIVENTGVLVKYKVQERSSGIVALTRGEWDTPSYRQWGVYGSPSNTSRVCTVGSGPCGRQDNYDWFITLPGSWHYVFLGMDGNKNLIQLTWNAEAPSTNHFLAYHNYGYAEEGPYHLHVAGHNGKITIGETHFYQFSGYVR